MSYSLIETFKRIVSEANRFTRVDFGGYDIYMQTNDGRTITATIRFDGGGQDQAGTNFVSPGSLDQRLLAKI